ncbi:MAG: 5-(carboxyamino)imidazole ribonucleotide synthase [Sphingomonadaceae bacterium]
MTAVIPPGSTIGVLGGGQLGRMLAIAAAQLGYHVHIYAPEAELVAGEVAGKLTRAAWDDQAALAHFADACDVITYEFENIPAKTIAFLESARPVRPGLAPLDVGQDRLSEKQFVESLGGITAPYRAVENLDDLLAGLDALGVPAILKTRRFGYDGKGQVRITDRQHAAEALGALGGKGLLLEGLVRFPAEFSVVMARAEDGRTIAWPACQNRHDDGILAETIVPAVAIDPAHVAIATALVTRMANELSYVGVLACEFFATASGPVFNEMAPRVHNSGHWTIEGARTSQFEQHIRAICGLPFGAVELTAPHVVMRNLLGDAVDDWASLLADPRAHLHLYGKSDALPGRKMGHVTIIGA